jgi:hypothetical protein
MCRVEGKGGKKGERGRGGVNEGTKHTEIGNVHTVIPFTATRERETCYFHVINSL